VTALPDVRPMGYTVAEVRALPRDSARDAACAFHFSYHFRPPPRAAGCDGSFTRVRAQRRRDPQD
jgi:hypothetical protein